MMDFVSKEIIKYDARNRIIHKVFHYSINCIFIFVL